MNQIDALLRFGYAVMIITILLMIWASLAGARELENHKYPPCIFSPLCTCSKASPNDLGIIQCHNAPYPSIPRPVNNSKVFKLHMDNTGLHYLHPNYLHGTGLYRIEISNNPIAEIPDGALDGLERSLWELSLHHNQFVEIPSRAIRNLKKLKYLDLSHNQIDCIEVDSFSGLGTSLEQLNLADNLINSLPRDAFATLMNLEQLDLSGNNLAHLDSTVFQDGMPNLAKFILADNVLTDIPYNALIALKSLRYLDLSNNIIKTIQSENALFYEPNSLPKLTLDTLHLEFNRIREIPSASFTHFNIVNTTYLDGNPLRKLGDRAFESARIRELYIRHCGLSFITPISFDGLGKTLQILDLSGNNLTGLPNDFLQGFADIKVLNIKDNKLKEFRANEILSSIQYSIEKFDMSGDGNAVIDIKHFNKMRSIRSLSLGRLGTTILAPGDFVEFGLELEDLKLTHSSINSIKSHSFKNVRGIRRLDLSENQINEIENEAFTEIGHSLISLKIAHGLSSKISTFPAQAFHSLTSLQNLDFSNNQLKSISDTSFHFLHNLRTLELNDNAIELITKGTFQGDIHTNLEILTLHFNKIRKIEQHTFADLKMLNRLRLDDNQITFIDRRAFMNLNQLQYLTLRGNKLEIVSDEAFQNLPELELLDIAYNTMVTFDFNMCDQVGTLSSLRVNASHNRIIELTTNQTYESLERSDHAMNLCRHTGPAYHSNIKVLDLSHNVITSITANFFRPAEVSLTHLYLAHNQLTNISRPVFGHMPNLYWLDVSYNLIGEVDPESFFNSRKLQVLDLSQNIISDIPEYIFKTNADLRIVNLSHNKLRNLPDGLFFKTGIESLDLSHNILMKIPVMSLTNAAAWQLCHLDLSNNVIGAIHGTDLSKFRALTTLDLSNNRLFRLDDAAFTSLSQLSLLDLSNNNELKVMDKAFLGLEDCLLTLKLNNISLTTMPELALPSLRALHLSRNELPSVPQELAYNLTSIRNLDLSLNDLTNIPLMVHSLHQLKSLNLASNPISMMSNNTLFDLVEKLNHLDISNLHLSVLENGALGRTTALRSLHLSTYPNIVEMNIPNLLRQQFNLRSLWINAPEPQKEKSTVVTDLRKEMTGPLPHKLHEITIAGKGFTSIADNILKGAQSKSLHLCLYNTSITSVPENLFRQMGRVQNISIDVSKNNKALTKLSNPNTAQRPLESERVYLTNLKIAGNSFSCDCEIGWMEYWYRKQRQYVCRTQTWTEDVFNAPIHSNTFESMTSSERFTCDVDENRMENELRETACSNKNSGQLIEILKSELECGWNVARLSRQPMTLEMVAFVGLLSVTSIWI